MAEVGERLPVRLVAEDVSGSGGGLARVVLERSHAVDGAGDERGNQVRALQLRRAVEVSEVDVQRAEAAEHLDVSAGLVGLRELAAWPGVLPPMWISRDLISSVWMQRGVPVVLAPACSVLRTR